VITRQTRINPQYLYGFRSRFVEHTEQNRDRDLDERDLKASRMDWIVIGLVVVLILAVDAAYRSIARDAVGNDAMNRWKSCW
jgi:hypothetical protein